MKISLSQFYGIEINDFAVSVANTALWIAQLQANIEAQTIIHADIDDLPLRDAANIVHHNALKIDWTTVISPADCNYIIGTPPFIGYSKLTESQKSERGEIFKGKGGLLDYVACWHQKTADFAENTEIKAALVSTNSICQGQQVEPLWKPLFERGIHINFAHRSFTWSNESKDEAKVTCIIVGFSYVDLPEKKVWTYRKATKTERLEGLPRDIGSLSQVENINGYLADAPNLFITKRNTPLSQVPAMAKGFQPTDNSKKGNSGYLRLTPAERQSFIQQDPGTEKWIRQFSTGADFIDGDIMYCLWLENFTAKDRKTHPLISERIKLNEEWRFAQEKAGDAYKIATIPHLMRPTRKFQDGTYIGVPPVSSERRSYVPMAFVDNGMIPGNQLYFIPSESKYLFGIIVSQFHNAWVRAVAGRQETRYRYGNQIVYNNFIFPTPTPAQKALIEECADRVIEVRKSYEGECLADLYDPDAKFLHPDLYKAHAKLDLAVEAAYGVDFSDMEDADREQAIVNHLFELYAEATKDEN